MKELPTIVAKTKVGTNVKIAKPKLKLKDLPFHIFPAAKNMPHPRQRCAKQIYRFFGTSVKIAKPDQKLKNLLFPTSSRSEKYVPPKTRVCKASL